MRFVDANVFIYAMVKSPKKDYDISRGILERIEKGEEAVTSLAVIQEVVSWLEYNGRTKEVRKFLAGVNSYLSLEKRAAPWGNFMQAMDVAEASDMGLVDALSVLAMKDCGINEVYSNDKDFDRVEWVKRIWK